MFRKIKRFFNYPIVEWVKNTEIDSHLEAKEYLLVETGELGPLFFTKSQVKRARHRVPKQQEDL